MQNWNMRTPEQVRRLSRLRAQHREILVFVEEVLHYQYMRKRALGAESPYLAKSWSEPPIVATFDKSDLSSQVTHMCCWGKRRPDTGEWILKPTMIKGTPEVCSAVKKTV